MEFEKYLKEYVEKGIIEFTVRSSLSTDDSLFYIHPSNQSGKTLDFLVKGNEIKFRSITGND